MTQLSFCAVPRYSTIDLLRSCLSSTSTPHTIDVSCSPSDAVRSKELKTEDADYSRGKKNLHRLINVGFGTNRQVIDTETPTSEGHKGTGCAVCTGRRQGYRQKLNPCVAYSHRYA